MVDGVDGNRASRIEHRERMDGMEAAARDGMWISAWKNVDNLWITCGKLARFTIANVATLLKIANVRGRSGGNVDNFGCDVDNFVV